MNAFDAARPARPEDAAALAVLIDRAGEGIPAHLWAQAAEPGQTALEVGTARAARAEGGFSYRNAMVVEDAGAVVAMVLGYRLPDPYELPALADVPGLIVPLLELEAQVPGSWYLNAIAVADGFEGRGLGRRLLALASELARRQGATEMSLIVAEENARARGLYERTGFVAQDRRAIVPFPGFVHAGNWVLLVKPLES